MNYCLLRMVEADANHNKDYEMEQISSTQFVAKYGRYGAAKQSKVYSLNMWDKLYDQKIKKGYKDITSLVLVTATKSRQGGYKPIEDEGIRKLVDELLRYANEYVKAVYSVSKKTVTPAMINEAQAKLDILWNFSKYDTVLPFNKALQELLVVIPQKVDDVVSLMAKSKSEMSVIADRQQNRLDTLKSLIDVDDIENSDMPEDDKRKTILEAFGLSIRQCTDKEKDKIKEKLSPESAHLFKDAWRIEQKKVEKRFNDYVKDNDIKGKDIHFFWHGTKNENVWSIMKTSLLLNPKASVTGKMFGYGLYFAPRAKKSIGYTSLSGSYWANGTSDTGYLISMKVAYKKPYDVYTHENRYTTFKEKDIKKLGCDAMFAHKGSMLCNDEVIVYNEAAVCPRYLIQLKN